MLLKKSAAMSIFCLLTGLNLAQASAQSFERYSSLYGKARLIQSNSEALKLRLALLDSAKSGARVRIATFVFDYGRAVETLTAHMCSAARRGVSVELLADSKSGERPGQEDAFDGTKDAQKVEELYQYLANCGVKIYIHNAGVDFVKVAGTRLPNIFGVPTGSSVNPLTALNKLKWLKSELSGALRPTLDKLGIRSDLYDVLDPIQSLILELRQLTVMSTAPKYDDTATVDPVEQSIEVIASQWKNLLRAPFWNEVNLVKMTEITQATQRALNVDPELSSVRAKIRAFNRLNHRKLFIVDQDGLNCTIIGGRNLGDHYLTDSPDSFHDADVFLCSSLSEDAKDFGVEANASFEELTAGGRDPMLRNSSSVLISKVRANPNYSYQSLQLNRLRLSVSNQEAPVNGIELTSLSQPLLLSSAWNPASDEIRRALLEGIVREQKEIYIETAYAEFNKSVRRAIEKALSRGVKVHVVTNGMFISDGASKLIRLWMQAWNEDMLKKYPRLFKVEFATLAQGHMIHFKGAGFRCQKGLKGNYRMYLLGSHNFHPRSGYSDKEVAIEWRESAAPDCAPPSTDLIAIRKNYYDQASKKAGQKILVAYPTLTSELAVVRQSQDPVSRDLARALTRALFTYNGATGQFDTSYMKLFDRIEDLVDDSGMRDLIGHML